VIVAVYDANILASGLLTSTTPPGQILDAWRRGQVTLIVSEHILSELAGVLQKAYFRSRLVAGEAERFLEALRQDAVLTPITVEVQGVATHPEDDLVLATAVSGQADYLVTGDGPLRRQVPGYRGVRLVTAREFVELLARDRP